MPNLGNALKKNMRRRKIEQKIPNHQISSRNRNINSFETQSLPLSLAEKTFSSLEPNTVDDFLSQIPNGQTNTSTDQIKIISSPTYKNKTQFKNFDPIKNATKIQVMRRPVWKDNIEHNATQLSLLEENAFIEWRKNLSQNFSNKNVILTPYEKNLEIWRQLWRVIERSHLLIQIVDARNPLLYYCKDLELYVKEVDAKKECHVLVNKADLLTGEQKRAWKKYFDYNSIKFSFYSAIQPSQYNNNDNDNDNGNSNLIINERDMISLKTLNSRDLIEHLESHCASRNFEKRFVVGMIGFPNVGKSSVINSLLGEKRVRVGITPGKTKHLQTLNLGDKVTLCDCPGLVFPTLLDSRAELLCSGILSLEHSKNLIESIKLICRRVRVQQFMRVYKGIQLSVSKKFVGAEEFLAALARLRGWVTACKVPNFVETAKRVLKDYVEGKLLYCFPPPGEDWEEEDIGLEDESEEDYSLPAISLYDDKLGNSKKKHLKKMRQRSRREWKLRKSENICAKSYKNQSPK